MFMCLYEQCQPAATGAQRCKYTNIQRYEYMCSCIGIRTDTCIGVRLHRFRLMHVYKHSYAKTGSITRIHAGAGFD